MINLFKVTFVLNLIFLSLTLLAEDIDCPKNSGKYGLNKSYSDYFCRIMVAADKKESDKKGVEISRNVTLAEDCSVQFVSNFPGTIGSNNSMGAKVYYIFPKITEKAIKKLTDDSGLIVTHPSGVHFNFDNNGKISSPDIKMKVSPDINSQNESGIEIESYQHGIVVDVGYKMGGTPKANRNSTITVTDKNKKKCSFPNNQFHTFSQKGDAEIIYKTNESLHKFLAKKCPQLDISDLLKPIAAPLKVFSRPFDFGSAPAKVSDKEVNHDERLEKPEYDSLEELMQDRENGKESIGAPK